MDFVVIDVETANPDLASICQIGVAIFADEALVESWSTYVNPHDYFDPHNVYIHGIDEDMVAGAPSWSVVHERLLNSYAGLVVASHTPFDRIAIRRACHRVGISPFDCKWLDTARVVRRSWPEFSKSGYGLKNVAKHLGIAFQHHDAEEDALTAGKILLHAIELTGLSAEDWCVRVNQPIAANLDEIIVANSEGPLFGNVVVFTGSLAIPRSEAAYTAARLGCVVGAGVSKHTTLLVVGDQDISKLAGESKSSKHRKAEGLIAKGQPIRILGESDFNRLLEMANADSLG